MKLHLPNKLRAAVLGLFALAAPCAVTIATASSAVVLFGIAQAGDVVVEVQSNDNITTKPTLADGDTLTVNVADEATNATWGVQIPADVTTNPNVGATVNVGRSANLTVGGTGNVAKYAVFAFGSAKTQTINLADSSTLNTTVSLAGWQGGNVATVVDMGAGSTWNIQSAINDACEYMNRTTINMDSAVINIASGKSLRVERNGDNDNAINVYSNSGTSSITGEGTIKLQNHRLNLGVATGEGEGTGTTTPTLSIGVAITGGHGIQKTGNSILELTNTGNTYTGGTTVNGGTLKLGGAGGKAGTGTITVAEGAVLELAHTAACTTGNTVTNNGTLSVTGVNETLTNMTGSGKLAVAGGAQLTIGGNIVFSHAIANNGAITLGDNAVLDITSLTMEETDNGGRWQVLTGSQLNLQTVIGDKDIASVFRTGIVMAGKTWSVSEDGYLSYADIATLTCTDKGTADAPLSWVAGAQMDGDSTFSQESAVTFKSTNYAALGEDIRSDAVIVDENAGLSLDMAGHKLEAGLLRLNANSTLTLTGTALTAGKLVVGEFDLSDTSALSIAWSSRGHDNTFFAAYQGNIVVKEGASLMCGFSSRIDTTFSQVTVEDGGQFATNGSHHGNITITGDGVNGTDRDQKGALKLGGDTTLTGDVTITGGSAAISLWRDQGGTIDGALIGEQEDSTLKLLNGDDYGLNSLTVQGAVSNIKTFEVERGTLTLNGAVSGIEEGGVVKTGAGILFIHTPAEGLVDLQGGTVIQAMKDGNWVVESTNGTSGYNDNSFTGYIINGTTACTGDLAIKSGTVSFEDAQGTDAGNLQMKSITVSEGATLRIRNSGSNSRGTDINLAGGKIYLHDTSSATSQVQFGTLNLTANSQMEICWKGGLSFEALTGRGDLGVSKIVDGSVSFAAVKNYKGTVTNSNVATLIGHVHQDAGNTATFAGNATLTSTDFRKTGEGGLSLANLTASGKLYMNYEGVLNIGSLTVGNGTTLVYTGDPELIKFTESNSIGTNLVLDLSLFSGSDVNLGLRDNYDTAQLTVSGLTQDSTYNIAAKDDGYLHLTLTSGGSIAVADWDINWGEGNVGAPTSLPTADLSGESETIFAVSADSAYAPEGAGYAAIELTGAGKADLVVVGGKNSDVDAQRGTVTMDTWIRAAEGTYKGLVGGNYAQNWDGGAKMNFVGDRHILVDGAEVGSIIGSNWKDGGKPDLQGDVYISVKSGTVTGGIIGGSLGVHSAGTTMTGDVNIFVYTRFVGGSVTAMDSVPNVIIGGNAYGSNVAPGGDWAQTLTGNTKIVVDLSSYTGEAGALGKAIIGGNYTNRGGAYNQLLTGNTEVLVNLAGNSTGELVIGGSYSNSGTSKISGNTNLTIEGGTYTARVVGGSYSNNGTAEITGNTSLTIKGGTFNSSDGQAIGGSYVNSGTSRISGNTNLTIEGGTLNRQVIGGTVCTGANYANNNIVIGGKSTLTINGGEIHEQVIGGIFLQDSGAGQGSIGSVGITLNNGGLDFDLIGALYAIGGRFNLQAGQTDIALNGGSIGRKFVGGMLIQGNSGDSVEDTTLGDINITLAGSTVAAFYGGTYCERNSTDGKNITQGDITINLNSGQVNSVHAAGAQLGSTRITTASTTVNLSKDVTFNGNVTLSGGYEFGSGKSGSTVTGSRTLVFTSDEAYANLGSVTIKDFDVVKTSGVDMDLSSNFTVVESGLTKQGEGKLTVGTAHGDLSVGQGELALNAASTLTSVAVAKGAKLTSAAGTNVALSALSLDVTGLQASDGLYLDLAGALVKAGSAATIALDLTGVENLDNDTYTLAHWVGGQLQGSDFNLTNGTPDGKVHTLTVENNSLVLTVRDLTGDLYWKGTNGTWDATDLDWVKDSASTDMMAYTPNSTAHFVGDLSSNHDITVQGAQSAAAMEIEGGTWSFSATGDGNSLSVGKGGISINADSVSLAGNVSVDGVVKMNRDNSTLVIADGTELALSGMKLANTTVTHTGTSEDVLGITSANFSMAGGTLTNTTDGDVTVGMGIGDGVALVQSGGGTLTLGGTHTLSSLTTTSGSVALTGTTTVSNTGLTGSAVTTGGAAFSLGSNTTTVTDGSVTTSEAAINATLTNVGLTTTNTGTTTITGTQTLTSLTNGGATTIATGADVTVTVSGNVQLKADKGLTVTGTLKNDGLVITGSTITATADKALSLWNGNSTEGQTFENGSITDENSSRIVNATLNDVNYTHTGTGTLTLNGTQSIGTLQTSGSAVVSGTSTVGSLTQCTNMTVNNNANLSVAGTISGTLTNDGTVTATGELSAGALDNRSTIAMDENDLTIGTATGTGGTITNAGTVSLAAGDNTFTAIEATTVSGTGTLSVAGESTIGTLNGVTGVTVTGADNTLALTTAQEALTLGGEGKLDYGTGALNLTGASDIGALKAGSLSLTGTSTLSVGALELTGGLISLSDLGTSVNGPLVTATGTTLGTDALKVGISAATIDAIAGSFVGSSLTLAQLTGLTDATFEDGTTTVSSTKFKREYSISVGKSGEVILTYQATGNGWVSEDGTWDSDNDFSSGNPDGKTDGEAAFMGGGTSTVVVSGDKTVQLLTVDVNAGSTVDTYTFKGDSITAETGLVQCGTMVVENTIHFTDSLTVTETPTVGHLTIAQSGEVIVDGKATGAIVNNGTLSVGEGSEITSLDGNGALTVTGATTVGMAEGASISTLTNGSTLTFTSDATVGTLANSGTLTADGHTLTLTNATTAGGDVTADNLTLADNTDNTFGTVTVAGTVTNSGTLTVGDGTSIGSLSGGNLTVADGAVSIGSNTTIGTLSNSGTLTADGHTLTLTNATTAGGNVTADNLTLADNTDNTFGTVTVAGTVTNSGTLTVGDGTSIGSLSGNGSLTTGGNVTVGTTGGDPTAISTLTVNDGTVTFNTDVTTVNQLAGAGTLAMGNDSTLALGGTADGCTANITAGTLDLTGSTGALNLGTLTLDTIVFDSGNPGTEDTALLTASSIADSIILEQDTADGLLSAGDYKLLSLLGGTVAPGTVNLANATISAYQAKGYAVELKVEGSTVQMVVVEDNARTWNTSGNTLEDTLGNTVLNADGTEYELALEGPGVYKSLDGVTYVHVDGDATIDLTEAAPDSATDPAKGLVVNNLSGNGGNTLSIVGDGIGQDKVTLATDSGFTPEQAANLSLTGLDATLEGDLSLKDLTMKASSLDAKDNTLTVENLAGDKDSKLSGTVVVTGSNSFLGTYAGKATVELEKDAEQTLNASDGLTVTGSGGTAKLVVEDGSAITELDTTGTNIDLSNSGENTLTLTETSSMKGGMLSLEVSLTKVSETLQGTYYTATTGQALELDGVKIIVTMTDTDKVSELTTSSTASDVVLFQINDHEDSAIKACTLTIKERALLDKYFSNIRLVQGSINVVGTRRTNYYGDKFTGLSANGTVGIDFAGLALSYIDPQNTKADGDMAKVLNALDDMAPGNNAAADKLGAAFAGAGTAAMGAALAGDMDRQLRAIRNRTTTMGVSSDYVYDDMPAFNAWINAEGDYRTLDADGTMAGYKLNSWGGTVGMDADITPHFTAGLAVTAMYGDLKADSAETKAEGDLDTYYVSLFARYADKAWVHTFVASVGMADLTMDRTVTCGTEGSYTTTGDTSGISFGLMYETGYVIALDEEGSACLQPVANITYKHTAVDGYTESGSDAALKVGDQTLDSVTVGVGARFQAAVGETVYNRTSLLEMRALAKVEAGDRSSSANVTLPGVPSAMGRVESAEADAFGIELGAGITIPVGVDAGAIFIDASAELRGSYTNVNGTVGYRINF